MLKLLGFSVALGLAAVVALGAQAQDIRFDMGATDACIGSGQLHSDCVGSSAGACMDATMDGSSTVGMGACLDLEWQVWDARLNAAYGAAMAVARAFDADNGGFGGSQAEALRAMQRAWIPYRDAACDFTRSQWGGGTGGGPATIDCLMRETARQTLILQQAAALN